MQEASGAATIDVDPYSTEVLANPYPFHQELREAGAVVWLEPYGVWATGRYGQVRACCSIGRLSCLELVWG